MVERRQLPTNTEEYLLLDHIDLESNELIEHESEKAKSKKKSLFSRLKKKNK